MNDVSCIRSKEILYVYRTINAVVVLVRIAERYGISPAKLLAGSGIEPADLADLHQLVTVMQEEIIARRFLELIPVPWIGLEVGREYHFSANGKLGIAVMCCETGIEALKLAMQYIDLTNSYHQYEIRIQNGLGVARMRARGDLRELGRFVTEAEVASIHSMACIGYEVSHIFKELHFTYPKPSYAAKYQELFGCPVVFNAPENMLIFDAEHFFRPMKQANHLVRLAMEKECAQLCQRLYDQETITEKIHKELALEPESFPTLEQMARRLHSTARTLRRRLSAECTSYKHILMAIRKAKAIGLLESTDLSLEEVAARLGFSDVSGFYRAFKGWTGCTPNTYRERNSK